MIRIVLMDNHDSFTGNLYQIFDENIHCKIEVFPSDGIDLKKLRVYDKIVFSPGPDIPSSYPQLSEILHEYSSSKSILGVCLGHQAIIEHWGGKLKNLSTVFHGQKQSIKIDTSCSLFSGLPETIEVGLYHSWAADKNYLPDCFSVTGINSTGTIMAVSHKNLDCQGIQFHPESYMTFYGRQILDNWVKE